MMLTVIVCGACMFGAVGLLGYLRIREWNATERLARRLYGTRERTKKPEEPTEPRNPALPVARVAVRS